MVLTTPAYFSKGWLPGWLNEQLKSSFDRFPNMELQLRWACVPRWEGISGWSYRHQEPKAVRRMVPAGSVYFFEVINGDPVEFVKEKWLMPMSDFDRRKGSFDQSDGCGMAVWGIWSPDSESIKEVQHGK
jgi:CRISPR-associated protein Cmr3